MKIYVASSTRNEFQPLVCAALKQEGHEVYDFREPAPGAAGFTWSSVDPGWLQWTPAQYLDGLRSDAAEQGFRRDMTALASADVCVMVMPCGMSASLEAGYAVGAGKPTAVYVPALREADLMVKMADLITGDLGELIEWVRLSSRHA